MQHRIFAHHAHVFPKHIREDGTIEVLLDTMDACGIEKAVAFATFHGYLSSEDENPNVWLADQLSRRDDRIVGFGVVDLDAPDIAGQVRQIADLGFRGIKLHPAFQKFRVDGEKAFEVYDAAQAHDLFLSFHTGVHWHRIKDYNMLRFDEVAYHFPRLRFSMEHLGGYCFFDEGLAIMINNRSNSENPRVYAGLTSVFDVHENKPWYLSDQRIKDLLWQTGEYASIFGLDFPYNGKDKIAAAIAHVLELDIPESAKARILGENLHRALGL